MQEVHRSMLEQIRNELKTEVPFFNGVIFASF